jgi:tRNA threonylcarbamoyladenosine biosynthesis protein TsaE
MDFRKVNRKLIIENISKNELTAASKLVLDEFSDEYLYCFYGAMGAGKTTFIGALISVAGSRDQVQSPTFGLVNEYQTDTGKIMFHFDLYRLQSVDEAFESGLFELLESGNMCFVEWPERIETALPERFVKIIINRVENLCRIEAERNAE